MDINKILEQVDSFYEENKGEEAEKLMQQSIVQAVHEEDDGSLLQLLNELLGYYRETSQKEKAFQIAGQAIAQAKRMGLEGTIPYATTLLNVANAYRACGKLQESMEYYGQVQDIYGRRLEPDSMFLAGLKNNISLLYQEMGDYARAKGSLLDALAIVEKKDAAYELAVTYANLASTCMQLGEIQEAYGYAEKSIGIFQKANVADSHYAAALATLGKYFSHGQDYGKALQYYRQAQGVVEKSLGRNEYYLRLQEHISDCEKALGLAGNTYMPDAGSRGTGKTRTADAGSRGTGKTRTADAGSRGTGNTGTADTENQEAGGAEMAGTEHQGAEDAETANTAKREAGDMVAEGREAKGVQASGVGMGLVLAREYYEAYGRPMIEEKFPAYANRIAVGLAGRGSDCFGYDDETSRDHDWGPGFCMWVTDETYEEIGEALQQAYEQLPAEFRGYKRAPHVNGRNRRGVIKISEFFGEVESHGEIAWREAGDASLAAAVNGEVFRDDEGIFTALREKLISGYPEEIRYLKLAESAAKFAQAAQYNYQRMLRRGDSLTAHMMVWDGIKEAMKLQHYLEGKYPPHDKWLYRSLQESEEGREAAGLLDAIVKELSGESGQPGGRAEYTEDTGRNDVKGAGRDYAAGNTQGTRRNQDAGSMQSLLQTGAARRIEELGEYFAMELYRRNFISDTDSYLDAHSGELLYKASMAVYGNEDLAEKIARLEFEAFDKVQNEGGRASCQNDWPTFSIMRKSQYLTWNRTMLLQYLYDFDREYRRGHNLIEEKYGRMMESTAPEKYEGIKTHFPELTQEKKDIIEQIVSIQVGWMEEFAKEYPALADNARSIYTAEDNPFNTSYETYLRGELGTYSDKMLELYGRYVAGYARAGKNLAYDIMGNSVKMYGYSSIKEAERKTAQAW